MLFRIPIKRYSNYLIQIYCFRTMLFRIPIKPF